MSRSTWACELKFVKICKYGWGIPVTLHVSVWVEIDFEPYTTAQLYVTLHVSVWVEINKFCIFLGIISVTLHVSVWVEITRDCKMRIRCTVTLHVSVWVEIINQLTNVIINVWSRSTWACELKYHNGRIWTCKIKSRSTWACELKLLSEYSKANVNSSRSTWACELKFDKSDSFINDTSHAPRERVSWNDKIVNF